MTPSRLVLTLSVAATTTALAPWPSASPVSSIGICRSPSLWSSSSPLLRNVAVCSTSDPYAELYAELDTDLDAELDAELAASWSHTAPCYRNGTTEYCMFSSTSFADGRGISILTTPWRAHHFTQQPAFAQPEVLRGINRDFGDAADDADSYRHPYEVVEIPGKGMGVVAARPLAAGDLIIANTASVLVDYGAFESVPPADMQMLQGAAVDHLPAFHRTRLLNLSTHSHIDGYLARVEKLLATNAFDIDVDDDEDSSFYVVFPEISRLNHDCRPNADYHFDPGMLTQYVQAVRPIARGEEITISYLDPVMSTKKRLDKLENTWGFKCSCSQCTQGSERRKQSDSRIRQINELRNEFHDYSTESRATPQMAELLVTLFELENLDSMLYEAYTYAAIEWNGVGEPWTASRYARLAVDNGLSSVGFKDPDVVEMQHLAADPWSHWSWMLRTSRRMRWGKDENKRKKPGQGAIAN